MRRGVVVGVYFDFLQLVERGRVWIEDIVKHIEHIAAVGGIDCVALGSDFDGMGQDAYPDGMNNWKDVPKLIAALQKAGFSESDIRKKACDNLLNYMKRFV